MKRIIILLIATISLVNFCEAQRVEKSVLDTGILGKWPKLSDQPPVISSKGKYVAYSVEEGSQHKTSLIIKNIRTGWEKTYAASLSGFHFFDDESEAVFPGEDSLHFVNLVNGTERRIKIKPSYGEPQSNWLTFKDWDDRLILINLFTKRKIKVGKASSFTLDADGRLLLYTDTSQSDQGTVTHLYSFDLKSEQRAVIWTGLPGEEAGAINFSQTGQEISFLVANEKRHAMPSSLWLFHVGTPKAKPLIAEDDSRLLKGFKFAGGFEFSRDGKWLFFSLARTKEENLPKPSPDAVAVDVWSYKDKMLQPQQLDNRIEHSERYEATISYENKIVRRLQKDEWWMNSPVLTGDRVVFYHQGGRGFYDPLGIYNFPRSYFIMSLKDGSRKSLKTFSHGNSFFSSTSPDGKWVVFYDYRAGHYLSYEVKTGTARNLTAGLPSSVNADYNMEKHASPVGIAGWIAESNKVLIYDNYDVWAFDPSGHENPVSVTQGYGLSHHVKLRIITDENSSPVKTYHLKNKLIFTGYNVENKNNGFFWTILGTKQQPRILTLGSYHYYVDLSQIPGAADEFDESQVFIKAARANVWVVKRQSAIDAPNYFATSDFKQFTPISNLAPQLNNNWLSTQLISYKQLDGTKCQGILYKPENFDSSKKYPVIFNYYQILSSRLNEFPYPEFMVHNLNIPWFVSHGYLVFTPDLYFQFANVSNKTPGENAYNSVTAAAKYLARLSYVDKLHMGIQGHSFGARQTNYLVSHYNLFAAASEMSGETDLVSAYLTLGPSYSTPDESDDAVQKYQEIGQGLMGVTLWDRPDLYLRESTVLHANHINTPLLMIHNKKDGGVQWRQGVELYMALRRLNKPSWMLQYDNGGHTLDGKLPESKDYTIRLTQFFDHYLKGYPPPVWMTRGVPAKMKGIETGYELDPKGECGPNCPICKKKDYKNFDPKLAVIKEFAKDPSPSYDN